MSGPEFNAYMNRRVARASPIPGFWMHETSGVLRPVVEAYFSAEVNSGPPLDAAQVATMRAYLRQWIAAPGFAGVEQLREGIEAIQTHADVVAWVDRAVVLGVDPF